MVWLFVLLTVVTYSFVMKYVLKNINKTANVAKVVNTNTGNSNKKLVAAHTTR
jgi:hypothetical protein